MYIYVVENLINNHWYIGKRCQPINSSDFFRYYGSGARIKKALKQYGKSNFKKTVLEECQSKQDLATKELYWLKKYILHKGVSKCYNILLDCNYIGREKGFHQTEEHIKKRVDALKRTGAYAWDEQRRKKASLSKKGKPPPNKGKKSIGIALSKTGEKNPNAKKVLDTVTGKTFGCIKEACDFYNIRPTTLWQYLNGKRQNKTNLTLV
jgi:group I intron endonuclease